MNSLLRMAIVLALCFGVRANAQDVSNQHLVQPDLGQDATQHPPLTEGALQVGVGVVCNSSDQVKRYLSLKTDEASIQDAIQVVNREANDERACGMAMVAFLTGHEAGNIDVTNGKMHVRQITIVAVAIDGGWQRIPETVQYTAFFEKLESA